MKKLRSVEEIGNNLNVILRMDLDLPMKNGVILDNSRLVKSLSTIKYLLSKNNKVIIVGHLGRPAGIDPLFSLKPVYLELMGLLEKANEDAIGNVFVEDIKDEQRIKTELETNQIIFVENLRFWPEEESGETSLFEKLSILHPVFVNDAFAVAHRKSASILLYQIWETYYGFSFVEEVEKISQIMDKKEKPMTIILGGAKEDKLKYLKDLSEKADFVLVGGKLPKLIQNPSALWAPPLEEREAKIVIAKLNQTGLDLNDEDIKKFKEIIVKSKTIVWAGAMGFYESPENRKGTEEIASAVAENKGYKIIAGGDTGASIIKLGLKDKIDFICSGGGVMLEFLTKGTLPAWG